MTGRLLLPSDINEPSQLLEYHQVAYQETYRQMTRALAFRSDLHDIYDRLSSMVNEEKPSRFKGVMRHLHKLRWITLAKLKEHYGHALGKIVTVAAVKVAYKESESHKDKTVQIA